MDELNEYIKARDLAGNGQIKQALGLYKDILSKTNIPSSLRSKIYNDFGVLLLLSKGVTAGAEQLFIKSIFLDVLFEEPYKNLIQINEKKLKNRHKFSVIISTYNRCQQMIECINRIRANSYFPVEIIIACDPCNDGTVEYLRNHSIENNIIAIVNDNHIGSVKSYNKGMQAATGNVIAMMADDFYVMPGWDLAAAIMLDADKSIGAAVPLTVYESGQVESPGENCPYKSTIYEWLGKVPFVNTGDVKYNFITNFPQYHIPRECDYAFTPIIRRECFDKLGLLDEQYEHYFVDPDLGYRIQQLGYKNVYCPTIVVVHHELRKKEDLSFVRERFKKDLPKFVKKWGIYRGF